MHRRGFIDAPAQISGSAIAHRTLARRRHSRDLADGPRAGEGTSSRRGRMPALRPQP
jgi:hypothetical protein